MDDSFHDQSVPVKVCFANLVKNVAVPRHLIGNIPFSTWVPYQHGKSERRIQTNFPSESCRLNILLRLLNGFLSPVLPLRFHLPVMSIGKRPKLRSMAR